VLDDGTPPTGAISANEPVSIEDWRDVLADLEQALDAMQA